MYRMYVVKNTVQIYIGKCISDNKQLGFRNQMYTKASNHAVIPQLKSIKMKIIIVVTIAFA